MRFFLRFVLLFAFLGTAGAQTPAPDYRNPRLPIPQRVADLLNRMTLEEKVEQLGGRFRPRILDTTGKFNYWNAREAFRELFSPDSKMSPHDAAVLRNAVQRYLQEKTRLAIPAILQGEALHGFMANGAPFPCKWRRRRSEHCLKPLAPAAVLSQQHVGQGLVFQRLCGPPRARRVDSHVEV
jgi:hypothetical protein